MATVYLGLGSNERPEDNLKLGVEELRARFGDLDLSPVYRSAAVGFEGADFLNLVARLTTDSPPIDIHEQIEIIHAIAGRGRGSDKFSSRPLDIDLLLYDDAVLKTPRFRIPRADILEYGFVLRPLADLAPDLRHPETGWTIGAHWKEFDAARHPLELVHVIL